MPTESLGVPRPADHTTETLPDGTQIVLDDHDSTRTFLVLHGGGGVGTVQHFAELLADRTHSRVLVPTHPGFTGTVRPADLDSIVALAAAYVHLLDHLDVGGVTVVGNSFGGWVAAEMALLASPRISDVVIVDGIGPAVAGHPMTDISELSPTALARLSFHDPEKAPHPPAGVPAPTPDLSALTAYTGPGMNDPSLLDRLAGIALPVRVMWGDCDGIVSPDYGRAFAAAIPGAHFTLLPDAGHLPQIEVPELVLDTLCPAS